MPTAQSPSVSTREENNQRADRASALRISVTYGPQKLETRNCAEAKLVPATSAAGQLRRKPLTPRDDKSEIHRQNEAQKGKLPSHHRGELHHVEPGCAGQRDDRNSDSAKGDRGSVGEERHNDSFPRLKAEPTSRKCRNRNRRSEPSAAFQRDPKQNATRIACTHGVSRCVMLDPLAQFLE